MTSTKFEEIMSKHNMHEKDEFKSIKSLNIFYQVKLSSFRPVTIYCHKLISVVNTKPIGFEVLL